VVVERERAGISFPAALEQRYTMTDFNAAEEEGMPKQQIVRTSKID
jgi:hypothetical protein